MPVKFKILYRISNSEHDDLRPNTYSKEKCFKSFKHALLSINVEFEFKILFDGYLDYSKFPFLRDESVEHLSYNSNSKSFMHAYHEALNLSNSDLVYFVEDDYLHLKNSINIMYLAANEITEGHYFTPYDHPVRYLDHFVQGKDLPNLVNKIWFSSVHWRVQESTCMTFVARVGALRKDYTHFVKYVENFAVPQDRELFRHIQGLTGFENATEFHLLLGPMPSLATHCHKDWMAKGIDWEKIWCAL